MGDEATDIVTTKTRSRGPRERMVVHAADLIGRDGVAATSIGDVIAASSAPRGSIYHHFPGGKTQLMTEAVRYAGDFIATRIGGQHPGSPAEAIIGIGDVWRRMLVATDYQFGCPVLAGGLARRSEPSVADEADEIFGNWLRLIAARLVSEGVAPERADSLANLVVAAIEGAVGLCQTQRSVAPLDQVIGELARLCDAAAAH
ncbi:TetR/AcrR family transcriptional regulator [Gordonia polyisoprenivorans]|uniref:TetR/AcrR family transcriptional regulator n=1 Tax=Gordonia polyisoprenivorans TaxID=84595 RepID=UPI001AD6E4AD|nr:TetR/AcrR family transcriptional regulator [Gordonia polyisoprenivorans]QTI70315.1 TetR/AcrR family transcriptional regulator [Gordonia polyisoprenivorans]